MPSRRQLLMGALLVATGAALFLGDSTRAEGPELGPPDRPGPTARVPAIVRVWHGKTTRAKADEYQRYLTGAAAGFRKVKGNMGYQVMRLDGGPDGDQYVEFQVASYWASLDAIKAYAGADVTRTHDLPRDKDFLVGQEPVVRNYRLLVSAVEE